MPDLIQLVIVDDHSLFRKGFAMLVKQLRNCKLLFEATDGQDFINRLDPEELPDIVLMALRMPLMDGFATTEWLYRNYPQVRVVALYNKHKSCLPELTKQYYPGIMSPGNSENSFDEDDIKKIAKCGAVGSVQKNTEPDSLKILLQNVMKINLNR